MRNTARTAVTRSSDLLLPETLNIPDNRYQLPSSMLKLGQ